MQIVVGGNQYFWMWFMIIIGLVVFFNCILWVMWVIVDIVEVDVVVCQRLVYLFGQCFKLGFGKFIVGNIGLVSDQYQCVVYFFQFVYCVNDVIDKFKIVDFVDVVMIDINSVVMVEKNCGY